MSLRSSMRLGLAVHIAGVVAFDTALGAGAVITEDREDDRVVGLALRRDRIQHAANLVIGLLQIAGVDLGLMSEQLFLIVGERVPGRQPFGPWRELGVGGNQTRGFLLVEGFLANHIPAAVKAPAVVFDPLLGNLVGFMRGAGGVVEEEGLIVGHRVVLMQPLMA